MGVSGIYMDMPLMSFSAIIIGVVVDDTIHFLFHYRESFARTGSYEKALEETLLSTGRPMLFTTMTMLCGFSVLLFLDMVGVVKFGGSAASPLAGRCSRIISSYPHTADIPSA